MRLQKKVYWLYGIKIIKWYGRMVDEKRDVPNHYFYETIIPGTQEYHTGNYQHKTLEAAKNQIRRQRKGWTRRGYHRGK